jgi:hypothetical protein
VIRPQALFVLELSASAPCRVPLVRIFRPGIPRQTRQPRASGANSTPSILNPP